MLRIIHISTLVKKVIIKDPKFKVDDCVRMSKYKSIFAKSYTHDLTLS